MAGGSLPVYTKLATFEAVMKPRNESRRGLVIASSLLFLAGLMAFVAMNGGSSDRIVAMGQKGASVAAPSGSSASGSPSRAKQEILTAAEDPHALAAAIIDGANAARNSPHFQFKSLAKENNVWDHSQDMHYQAADEPGRYYKDGKNVVASIGRGFGPFVRADADNGALNNNEGFTISTQDDDWFHDNDSIKCPAGQIGDPEDGKGGTCKACPPGFFCKGGKHKEECPIDSTSKGGASSVDDCKCVAGYHGKDAESCERCSAGFFCGGGNVMGACPTGATSNSGAASLMDCFCPGGSYGSPGSVCTVCPADAYCPAGAVSPTNCPSGAHSPAASTSRDSCQCSVGKYEDAAAGECKLCPPDSYCPGQGAKVSCAAGFESEAESTKSSDCIPSCTPGQYRGDDGTCKTCAAGSFCTGGRSPQAQCPANSNSPEGSKVASSCMCIAGTFLGVSEFGGPKVCTTCPADSYCPGDESKVACEDNSSSDEGSSTASQCLCKKKFSRSRSTGKCVTCPANSYCSGAQRIEKCPVNTQSIAGSDSDQDCKVVCGAGFYKKDGKCEVCPTGKYCIASALGKDEEPQSCTEKSNSPEGAKVAIDCQCQAGYYGSVSGLSMTCKACPAGSYCPGDDQIHQCPTGSTAPASAVSANNCDCIPGYYRDDDGKCDVCLKDNFCVGGGVLAQCPAGYESSAGADEESDCSKISCAVGNYHSGSSCDLCPEDSYCIGGHADKRACPAGATSRPGSPTVSDCICGKTTYGVTTDGVKTCASCPADQYCSGNDLKHACGFQRQSLAGSDSEAACKCVKGRYTPNGNAPDSSCIVCPANSFCGGEDKIEACPAGYKSDRGSTRVEDCSKVECPAGKYHSGSGCSDCPEGKYCPGGYSDAHVCPDNSKSKAGSKSTEDCKCSVGYRAFQGSRKSCLPCDANKFCPGNEKDYFCPTHSASLAGSGSRDMCTCDAGYYRDGNGLDATCKPCEKDHFCPGDQTMQDCPAGKSSSAGTENEGGAKSKDSCSKTLCAKGTYHNGDGCATCSAGQYCTGGHFLPTSCPAGSSSATGASWWDDCYCVAGTEAQVRNVDGTQVKTCKPCESGFYCPGHDQKKACKDKSSSAPGGSAKESCTCNAGFYASKEGAGACVSCTKNSYCPGDDEQRACPAGTSSDSESRRESDCKKASCPQGEYNDGNGCVRCPANKYCSGGYHDAMSCPSGSFSDPGAKTEDDCSCAAGLALTRTAGQTDCRACTANQYCPDKKKPVACPFSRISAAGSDDVADCKCPAGFSGGSQGACSKCNEGFYCPGDNQKISCGGGMKTSNEGAKSANDCTTRTCNAGQYSDGESCRTCQSNHFCPGGHQGMQRCPSNGNSGSGASSINQCNCPSSGQYKSNNHECHQCPSNHRCDGTNKHGCPWGQWSNPGSNRCFVLGLW